MPAIVSIRPSRGIAVFALLTALALPAVALCQTPEEHQHHQHAAPATPPANAEQSIKLDIPDISLVDQDGKPVRFYSDLVKGKVVAVSFIFTTCTTICPPMGATFGKLQSLLGGRAGRDVHLISVSVDPATDTPERMKAWGQRFNAGPGWTLVTGDRERVTQLLKALGAYTPSISDHSPLILVGNDARDQWTRAYGLAPPTKMVELIDRMAAPDPHAGHRRMNPPQTAPTPMNTGALSYFGEIPLVNQNGETMRLYSDVIKGRTVVFDFMFTSCTGVCPILSRNFVHIQDWLGDRLGKDVYLVSISVDPVNDTPAKLKEYAARFKARPGWYFLTGSKENVDDALKKLGQSVENREGHQNLFIIGNEPTGLWKKALGIADPKELIPIVASVLDDRGETGEEPAPGG